MPPRIPAPQGLRSLTLCLRPTAASTTPSLVVPLVQTASISMREKKRRMKQDPWGWAERQKRKTANLERRAELDKERRVAWGDPVHGVTTPFVESFDTAGQEPTAAPRDDADGGNPTTGEEPPRPVPTSPHILNYLLTKQELDQAIEHSRRVTQPLVGEERTTTDPTAEALELEEHAAKHAKAVEALQRLTDLRNGSAKDRRHANIRRCIETFGRHVTDGTIPGGAPPPPRGVTPEPKPMRAGPDTGSSEVQIAILTAKIRALALALEGPKGRKDKNNKRSLRLLCHKRQRLLRYMEKKERGSKRWQHMMETLGLTPATYKEQISI